MVFEPGYEVTTVTPPPIPSAAPPPRSAQISNTPRSGVTSFDPDYAVKSVAPAATGFLPVARGGVVSWLAGYDVTPLKLPVSDLSVTPALVPCGTPAAAHGVVAWAPGFEVRLAPAPTQFTHETIRETLGGLWTTSNPLPLNGSSLQGKLASQGLQAQAKLLPGLQTSDRIISWNDWYNRVSHAIYDRWENADTGPGTVRIRCVVKSTCNISAQVTGFTAAPDLERDVIKETQFRETALRSVNLVDNTPVLEFPFMSNRHEVTFELDLKRSVDGPGRCEVVFADSETVHR
jgi:hypothetical protein